jgi:hypothetical protein
VDSYAYGFFKLNRIHLTPAEGSFLNNCFFLLGIMQVVMLMSLLSKQYVATAAISIRNVQNVIETEKCNIPLYVIPSETTDTRFLLMQVRY